MEDLKEERGEAAKLALMAESGSRAAENGGWQEESGIMNWIFLLIWMCAMRSKL